MNDDYHFVVKKKRPEEQYENVIDYFQGDILTNYAKSKSIMRIQEKITIRAMEILDLKTNEKLILDAGCGPGFASIYLEQIGYKVVALDIISEFLYFYNIKELNPVVADLCLLPFKANTFNAIISISALQWIYKEINNKAMQLSLINLAMSIEKILKPKSKAIFQFYPKDNLIMETIGKFFTEKTNLKGKFIIDNPKNPKKRRIFLLLYKE